MVRSRVQTDNSEQVAASLKEGDERTLARVLTLVENRAEGHERILDAAYAGVGRAWRIGLTGPPGAGKSSLAARIIEHLLSTGSQVAYLGVDPSSPFSGGALLGDRIRLSQPEGGRFFARSLATRGAQGGLSEQTEASVDLLDAAGFDVVIVESAGVGQAEIDISRVVDTVVVVLVPESGDEIQTMKAGILEVGDVLCVNKADRANADALVAALRSSLAMRFGRKQEWQPAIVTSTALPGGSVHTLIEQIQLHRTFLGESGRWVDLRRDRLKRCIETLVTRRWLKRFWTPERLEILETALDTIDDTMPRPYALAERLTSSKLE
ncbi:MAG TPA: methylmalonyl Co-A mutase-associated GTPase MeaB [Rhodothermales bacterium]|nr:methylmalonyl Co-A mutase-associated GTPase MeaB [Rhodothermales bacterium]